MTLFVKGDSWDFEQALGFLSGQNPESTIGIMGWEETDEVQLRGLHASAIAQ
jgi:hypothetical protein